jgi:hypothetical protein
LDDFFPVQPHVCAPKLALLACTNACSLVAGASQWLRRQPRRSVPWDARR